ncbi:hypothetical protein V5799_008118 [Amblyomma americanum]|uniref:Uncharacterized protein n=1 Tax=Amblyomma americanum TaxID=6943 RepID=A0AAQ4FFN0_AMBAM
MSSRAGTAPECTAQCRRQGWQLHKAPLPERRVTSLPFGVAPPAVRAERGNRADHESLRAGRNPGAELHLCRSCQENEASSILPTDTQAEDESTEMHATIRECTSSESHQKGDGIQRLESTGTSTIRLLTGSTVSLKQSLQARGTHTCHQKSSRLYT